MKKHLPNSITLANLACGVYGIHLIHQDQLILACYMIGPALLFDFLDGFIARLLKVSSPIGKELDSLADMVTFGVLPGFIMYELIAQASCDPKVCTGLIGSAYFPYIAATIPLMSAMRLAKFNVDIRQTDSFIGLPTPACSIFIASLPLIAYYDPDLYALVAHPKMLGAITLVLAYLLVAEIPLIALKFKSFALKDNSIRYILVVGSVTSILLLKWVGLPLIILFYILLSIAENLRKKAS